MLRRSQRNLQVELFMLSSSGSATDNGTAVRDAADGAEGASDKELSILLPGL
jgi:hypothetical protein